MGIYDRDYERDNTYDDSPGIRLGGQRTWTTNLVIVMFAVYGIQLMTKPAQMMQGGGEGWFTDLFSLHADVLRHPWMAFELLTYGFLHDVGDLKHILFNMLALWMFGRSVEGKYGRHEYLVFFLAAVVFAGACWLIGELVVRQQMVDAALLGASGGIAAVLILFCLNFPHQQVFIWGILPLPAWVFAIVFVGIDMFGASGHMGGNVAYTAHLGGAAFALAYYFTGWRLTRWIGSDWKMPKLGRRPPLRVLDPGDDNEDSTEELVDNILRKIREQGQDSLTRGERRILEEASREYQKKRQ
jgi:membrane associated rhomboid family serine protease